MDALPTYRLEKVVQAPQEVMEDFEGPLDLILFLMSKHKIEIQNLQISLLCRQFLDWIEARQSLDLDVASDFILMASHLVYLKSRKLLLIGDAEDEELDALKQQLEAHRLEEERQRLLRMRDFFAERGELYRMIVTKPPEPVERDRSYSYEHDAGELLRVLQQVFERELFRRPPSAQVFAGVVGREPYPVGDRIDYILQMLQADARLSLGTLFRRARNLSEAVAGFLAVLELCRSRDIELVEDENDEYWVVRARHGTN